MSTYLKTLRRIPDDIILAVAARDLDVRDGQTCICGWAIREAVGKASQTDPEMLDAYVPDEYAPTAWPDTRCRNAFGGTDEEWYCLYVDIASTELGGLVEEAFVTRVMEAAGVA